MSPRVTALLVVHDGTSHVQATLDALAAQTRQPDAVIAIACSSSAATTQALERAGVTRIVTAGERLNFAQALVAGARILEAPKSSDEFLWLLAQDTAPAPDALRNLVGALEVAPSVAAAGPKLMDATDGSTIVSLGESMTPFGATVHLVEEELDQGQHDTESDVLGVAPGGMLVRHAIWQQLGGFDPGIGQIDDGLDFSVRVRLAGHRVAVVPSAAVEIHGDGVAGPSGSAKSGAIRKRHRLARGAQLYRRLANAPAAVVWLHWLSLVPLAILRSLWQIVRKHPELVAGELAAAFAVAFSGLRVSQARRTIARSKSQSWSAVAQLRIPFAEVRRRRRLRREAGIATTVIERSDLRFFTGGGGWLVIGSAVVGIALFFGLLTAASVAGGGMLPLSSSVTELWANVGYGWRDIGVGFNGAADPFAAVLAVLGSLTFWAPSYSMVLLCLVAMPLATLGGWFAATRLTERSGYRLVAAILWTVAPTFISALISGRPAAIIVHLLLPWLFYAGVAAARSWGAAAVASVLLAAVIAASPSLAPALIVLWLIGVVLAGRGIWRAIWVVIPSLALFAPLLWQQGIVRGNWLQLLADPGVVIPVVPTSGWHLALGFPEGNSAWQSFIDSIGLSGLPSHLVLPVLTAPLAIMALVALFLRGSARAAVLLFAGLLGLATAFGATHLMLSLAGAASVGVWPGAGLSLYWLGLIGAAVTGLDSLRLSGRVPAIVLSAVAVLVAIPVAAVLPFGGGAIVAGDGRTLPALVTAAAASDPMIGTLLLTPQPGGGVSAQLVRGSGETLDKQSTLVSTNPGITENDRTIAELAGNLVSQSGLDPSATLSELGVKYIILRPAVVERGTIVTPDAVDFTVRATSALDGNAVLAHVGLTDRGTLWRFEGDVVTNQKHPLSPITGLVTIGLIVVFGMALLLSIPTAASRRAAEALPRTVGRRDDRDWERRPGRAERANDRAEALAAAQAAASLAASVEAENGDARVPDDAPETDAGSAPDTAAVEPDPSPEPEPGEPAQTEPDLTEDPDPAAQPADVPDEATSSRVPAATETAHNPESENDNG